MACVFSNMAGSDQVNEKDKMLQRFQMTFVELWRQTFLLIHHTYYTKIIVYLASVWFYILPRVFLGMFSVHLHLFAFFAWRLDIM